MDRWRGKVAVVTGASAGIGLAIVKMLLRQGLLVVGLARRKDKMQEEIKNAEGAGKFVAFECDVAKEEDVEKAFKFVEQNFKTVHILINNAGIVKSKTLEEANLADLKAVINVNLIGVVHCSKEAIKLMKENNHEAHIININSIAGHKVPNITLPNGVKSNLNVYSPTKYAVTSLSEVLTNELLGSKIRITSLSPGYVKTEIGGVEMEANLEQVAGLLPFLNSEDIADAVEYIVGTPHHVQITELTIRPLGETF